MTQDKEKPIRFYEDKLRDRKYSFDSLRERVEIQYAEETAGRVDILVDLDNREKRFAAVMEVLDYILATESLSLPKKDIREIAETAMNNLFYMGPIDPYFRNPDINEVTVEGPYVAYYREGFGELKPLNDLFENLSHLERTLTRFVAIAGGILTKKEPFMELGVLLHNRPMRLSYIGPPVMPQYTLQFRLHPVTPLTMKDLVPEMIPTEAANLLTGILKAGHGLIVTGEAGIGKTTLVQALLGALDNKKQVVVVERAREMSLSDDMKLLPARPPGLESESQNFAAQIKSAIEHHQPRLLVLDEVRGGDEAEAFWKMLSTAELPQRMIAFQGTNNPARLLSALSMVIRRHPELAVLPAEQINTAIYEKLPFVAVLRRPRKGEAPRLAILSQWVKAGDSLTLEPLLVWNPGGEPTRMDAEPRLKLK